MLSSVEQAFVGREEIRAPLKTPAWEATYDHDVNFPYSMCYGGRKHTTASFRFLFKT